MLSYTMDKLAELNFILEELGMEELMNIVDNTDEVRQLLNKIGRPELWEECINELNNTPSEAVLLHPSDLVDPPYDFLSSSEEESECSSSDLVEEQYQVNPCGNGFFELGDVEQKSTE